MAEQSDQFLILVQSRLDQVQQEVKSIRDAFNGLDAKVQAEIKILGKRPGKTAEEITQLLEKLEYKHAHSSMSNSEERNLMREMEKMKKDRKAYEEYR